MTMIVSLVIDGLIILLLGVAIGYAVLLNGRLRRLRESSGELEKAVLGLDGSIVKAETGLDAIREAAEGVGRELDQRVEPAKSLAGELGFVVERGEAAAERLEKAISNSRMAIAAEEAEAQDDARRFARALSPLSDDDVPGLRRPRFGRESDEIERPAATEKPAGIAASDRAADARASAGRFVRRPFEDAAPRSRGAALVQALRGMR